MSFGTVSLRKVVPHAVILVIAACVPAGGTDKGAAPASSVASPPPELAPVEPAAVVLDTRTRGWETGKEYGYRLKLTSAVAFGDAPNAFDFDVAGDLVVTPVTASPEVVMMYASMANAKLDSRIRGSQPEYDKISAELRGSYCFFTLTGGRLSQLRLPVGLSPMSADIFRTVASALQFAHARGGAERYTAEEYDTTGQYVSEYQRDREPGAWIKRKQIYRGLLAAKTVKSNVPAKVVPEVVASQGYIRLSTEGRPMEVALDEQVAVNGAQVPVRSKMALALTSPSELARAPSAWQALIDKTQVTGADEPYGSPGNLAALDAARIDGMTFNQVLSRLERIARDPQSEPPPPAAQTKAADPSEQATQKDSIQENQRLFQALAAIFRQKPGTVGEAVRKIRTGSPAATVLIDALGSASSADAQKALVELMNDRTVTAEVRSRATTALGRTVSPEAGSVAALKALLVEDPFSPKALYGLGTFSRRLRDSGNVEGAKEIGEFLLERLRMAKDRPLSLTITLRALSNAGYAGGLSDVLPYVTNEDEQIRVDAVRALQSMQDARVDGILAERLESDSSNDVRISAIEAARVRQPSDVVAGALVSAAKEAPNPRVRYQAVDLMVQWLESRPDLRATLEVVANTDEQPRIRHRAEAAL
jgi:hypothetical protein